MGAAWIILQDIISFTNINTVSAGGARKPMIFSSLISLVESTPELVPDWSRGPISPGCVVRHGSLAGHNWRRPLWCIRPGRRGSEAGLAEEWSGVEWSGVEYGFLGLFEVGGGGGVRSVSLWLEDPEEV